MPRLASTVVATTMWRAKYCFGWFSPPLALKHLREIQVGKDAVALVPGAGAQARMGALADDFPQIG
jgi:hypothetical protein